MKTNELKCTDLRIGNYLKYDDEIIQVSKLCKNYVEFYDNEDLLIGDNPEYFEPIELTEEVLLKIGFEDRKGFFNYSKVFGDDNSYCDSIHIYYCPMLNHFKFTHDKVKEDDLQKMDLYNIQYLHQPQNLYYLLTNEELEVEL